MTEGSTEVETFYRWVSTAEWEDIEEYGQLRPNPDGSGYRKGKLVTDSPQHAVRWGDEFFGEYPDDGTVIEVTIESAYVQSADYIQDPYGPAYFIPEEHLSEAEVDQYEQE